MFNFRDALLTINGDLFTLDDLQRWMSDLRLANMGEIPPEIGVRELILLGLDRHWIVEEANGNVRIQIPQNIAA